MPTGNTQQIINYGAAANDGQGDPLRTAFIKTDENFDNIWLAGPVGSNVRITNNTISALDTNGNIVLQPNGVGIVQANAHIIPSANNIRDLGSVSSAWRRAYINESYLQTLSVTGDAIIDGNLVVEGNVIHMGNVTTDSLTIQLANTAANSIQANGAGVTVGANDDIATILYDSGNNVWATNIGLSINGAITGTSVAVSDATIYGNIAAINGNFTGNIVANYFVGNGSLLTGITSYANANAVAYGEAGWAGNIIPAANAAYSLGNSTMYWSNLWVANNTIYIGGVPLGISAGNVLTVGGEPLLSNDSNTSITTTGNITANIITATGAINVGDMSIGELPGYITADANIGMVVNVSGPDGGFVVDYLKEDGNANTSQGELAFSSETGNATYRISLTDDAGDGFATKIWRFDGTGNLTLPSGGNIIGAGNVNFNNGSRVQTATNNINLQANVNGAVELKSHGGNYIWGFDNYGWMTLPEADAAYTPVANGSVLFAPTAMTFKAGLANLIFDYTGNLTLPTNGSIVVDGGDGVIGPVSDDMVISWDNEEIRLVSVQGSIEVQSNNDFRVQIGYDGGSGDYLYKWLFTNNNELVNITGSSAIVTEAGDLNLQSGRDTLSSGNVSVTAINNGVAINTWTFGLDGNLTLPSQGNIVGTTPNNAGRIQWVGNSSGDGSGYTTLRLVPDDTLEGGDQYLIIDPTGPTHIHIRAGGTQDDSAASLYLGGEKNYVNVLDNSGVRIQNETTGLQTNNYFDPADFTSGTWFTDGGLYYIQYLSDNAQLDSDPYQDINEIFVSWNSGSNSSYLTYGGSTQNLGGGLYKVRVNEAPPAEPQVLGQISYILNVTRNSYATLTNHNFEVSADNAVSVVGKTGIQLINQNSTDSIRVTTDNLGNVHTWEFGVDGTLDAPGNITANSFIGDGSQLTGLPPGYTDADVATFLAAYGSNTISTTGNITAGNFIGSGTNVDIVAGSYDWTFDSAGTLTLPGNTFAVNYANGTAVSLGGNYNDSNVATLLAAFGSNTISTTGNVTASYFFGNGSQLTAVNAVTADVTNTNGLTTVYYPTFVESRTTGQILRADTDLSYRADTNTLTAGRLTVTASGTAINAGSGDILTNQVTGTQFNFLNGLYTVNLNAGQATANYALRLPANAGTNGQTLTTDGTGNLSWSTAASSYGNSNVATFLAAYGSNTISTTGNITAGNLIGNISITGNVTGTSANVDIIAGSYQWTFNNTGNLVLPGNTFTINYANGTAVTLGGSYGNANVADFLDSLGSNAIVTTGNVTAGNLITSGAATTGVNALLAGPTFTPLANTSAGFVANVNSYSQITFQNKNAGADATADYILTADNGSDTVNYGDFGIINSGYDVNTPTNSLGNIVRAGDTYIYAQGNVSNTSQSGGNLIIGTTVPTKNVKIFAGGANNNALVANISNTGISVTGNVTATNFIGNVSLTGNIQGTSANVELVAGSYTFTFDNTGVATFPAVGGDEGGEINFGIPAANTTLTSPVKVDVYQDRIRFFDGSTKGAYIDMSQAGTGVSTLLNNRVSGYVNAGTYVTMDNLKATVSTAGNRSLQIATVSGSYSVYVNATYTLFGGGTAGSGATFTLTTTPTLAIAWNFTAIGDTVIYIINDITNSRTYRVTMMIGPSYNNNLVSIERLI